jgi:hypothetical protein
MFKSIVVTRHMALLQYLKEEGLISGNEQVFTHVTENDVKDKHVFGVLPLRLAALTFGVTEVALDIPEELRGKELTIEQVRQYALPARTYVCKEVN